MKNNILYHTLITLTDIYKIDNKIIKNRFEEENIKKAIKNYENIAIQDDNTVTFYSISDDKINRFSNAAELIRTNGNLKHRIIIKCKDCEDKIIGE